MDGEVFSFEDPGENPWTIKASHEAGDFGFDPLGPPRQIREPEPPQSKRRVSVEALSNSVEAGLTNPTSHTKF